MRKIPILIIFVLMLTAVGNAQAALQWDIYSDAVIEEGDWYGIINVYDTPPNRTTLIMFGGYADYIHTHDSSILNVLGGDVQVKASDHSVINIYGGDLSGAEASDYAVVNFSGDAISRFLIASDFGVANMYGGIVDSLRVSGSGLLNLYCGQVTDYLSTWDDAVVNIFGHDLGKINVGGIYGYGQVYGFLLDDSSFTIDFCNSETYSHVNLIPEPTSLTLLGLGSLVLLYKKKITVN